MNKLQIARDALASVEQNIGSDPSLQFLAEGLDVLDEVANDGGSESEIARRIGNTYFEKTCNLISATLEAESETDPSLEMLLNILREFGNYEFGEKEQLSYLKVKTFIQWFNRFFQGYTQDEKKQILQNLQLRP